MTPALANLRAAWDALALIRETVEDLAPPGSVTASEYLGPDPMQEAEALVRGIEAIAARARRPISCCMDLHIFPDHDHPHDWRVEDTDADGDGACLVVIFSGYGAEERAREYYEWRRGRG